MTSLLEIELLGRFHHVYGGEPVTAISAPKRQLILAYLLLHADAPLSRRHLAFLLWPNSDDSQALTNLRKQLYHLRHELPDAERFLHVDSHSVHWQPQAPFSLDVAQFQAAVERAEEALERSDDGSARAVLEEVVELYQGDLLPGHYDDWLLEERERLRRRYTWALDQLVDLLESQGDYGAAIHYAERLLTEEPLRERLYRRLMLLHARRGARARALAVYEESAAVLQDELGIGPAPATQRVYERVLKWEGADEFGENLPARREPLIGRQTELGQLEELLADPHVRLVTITGVGGVGKTRLAYAAARQQLERRPAPFADGVYAVSLVASDSPAEIVPAIADALDLVSADGAQGEDAELDQLVDYLREKEILLVLDNFEHLLDGAGIIGELLQGATALSLLITSRERLNLSQEHNLPLAGFANGQWEGVDDARSDPFVQLFLDGARRVRPDYELRPEDLKHLRRLWKATGGLPLAVELAASWVDVLSVAEIATEIGRDIDFLRTDLRDVPPRQRSMRAVFEASWRRLNPALQTIFSRLSLFRGGFTREAVQEIAGASLPDLATLSAKSLLEYEAGSDRYQIHELLRQFGLGKLQEQPDLERETRQRHAAFYCGYLQKRGRAITGARAEDALAGLEREWGNVRLAWRWAAAQGEVVLLAEGVDSLGAYYERRGYHREARELLRSAEESLLTSSGKCDEDLAQRRLLVRLLAWRARFAPSIEEARTALGRAETMLRGLRRQEVDARREEALFALGRGNIEMLADPEVARPYLERALSLYEEIGDVAGTAWATTALGRGAWHLGKYRQAADLLQRALEGHEAVGNRIGMAETLGVLGLIEKHRSRLVEAEQAHRESYALYRDFGSRTDAASMAGTLTYTLCWLGDFTEAYGVGIEGLHLADELGSRLIIGYVESTIAKSCVHLSSYCEGRQHAERAIRLARDGGDRQTLGWALFFSGQLRLVADADEEGVARLEEAAAVLAEYKKSIWFLPLVSAVFGLRRLGQPSRARRTLAKALRENMIQRVPFVVVNALPIGALLLVEEGEEQRALELYGLAQRYPCVANSRWFYDMAGQELEAMAASLPPGVAAAAQERGRARELWQTAEELIVEFGED